MSDRAVGLGDTVLRDLFGTPELRAALDSTALVQGWLDAEVALARAEADVGVIPESAALRIAAEGHASLFDLEALREGVAESQHPLVPLIRALVERCGDEGGYVHWGATTQDITDTGMMLQARAALTLIRADLAAATRSAEQLAVVHARDPMPGRTHGQHAVPIAFGLKAASWADELGRCLERIDRVAQDGLCAQLAGAAGSLASLGADAAAVRSRFAEQLGLREASVGWHVARDRVRELAHVLGQVASAGERIAAEIVRLQASEVAELREPAVAGHVGSSTMPQKRNPMTSEYLIASARLVHGATAVLELSSAHAGERDMGLWAIEWIAVPQALILTGSVASKLAWVLAGLEVDTARMRQNLELSGGAIMAEAVMMQLAGSFGHERAHRIVSEASKRAASRAIPLAEALLEDPALAGAFTPDAIRQLVATPDAYLGSSSGPT
ncbi:MAG: adenylosuccinate lyase family protein [Gaiellales bacterium]